MKSYQLAPGYQEIIFSVKDIRRTCELIEKVFRYEIIERGDVDRSVLDFWGLPESASAREVLYRHVHTTTCYLRIIQFDGVDQELIRPHSQSWDTGGIYDIDVRVLDFDARTEEINDAGFIGFSAAERYQLGTLDVEEILMKGHEDLVIAVMTRHAPPLENYPHLTHLSEPFNSAQICKDYDAAASFYIDTLGFTMCEEFVLNSSARTNLFGIPRNLYNESKCRLGILSSGGGRKGSFEIVGFETIEGRDFTDRAIPPNLGMLMYRTYVEHIEAYHNFVQSANPSPICDLSISGYGQIKVFYLKTPDGVWLEFMESI